MDVISSVILFLMFIYESQLSNPCKNDYRAIHGHTACLYDDRRVKKSGVSRKQKELILRLHNKLRGKVKVKPGRKMPTDLVEMVWDDEIAMVAQKWANQCSNDHDGFRHRYIPAYGVTMGQNLAYGYKSWKKVIRGGWYKEITEFYYGRRHGVVGHFTQMVSNRAIQIGCGFAFCSNTRYKRYYVCNYAAGQTTFTHPFTPGRRCAACPGNCVKGLCSKECTGKLCKNGGKLELYICACKCPVGYTGTTCERKGRNPEFDRQVISFRKQVTNPNRRHIIHIQPNVNVQTSRNTWAQTNCFGKRCRNGGTLDSRTCACHCPKDYFGIRCEEKRKEKIRRVNTKDNSRNRYQTFRRRVITSNRGNTLQIGPNIQTSRNDNTATANCPMPMDNPEGCGTVFKPDTCIKYYNIKDKCPYMCGVCQGRVQRYRSRQGCIFHGVRPSAAQCRTFGDGSGKDKWFCASVGGDWDCSYCTKYTNIGKDCAIMCGLCD